VSAAVVSTEPFTAPAARSSEDLIRGVLARVVRLVDALADGEIDFAVALAIEIEGELLVRLVDREYVSGRAA
jgi:hypothetical protein